MLESISKNQHFEMKNTLSWKISNQYHL